MCHSFFINWYSGSCFRVNSCKIVSIPIPKEPNLHCTLELEIDFCHTCSISLVVWWIRPSKVFCFCFHAALFNVTWALILLVKRLNNCSKNNGNLSGRFLLETSQCLNVLELGTLFYRYISFLRIWMAYLLILSFLRIWMTYLLILSYLAYASVAYLFSFVSLSINLFPLFLCLYFLNRKLSYVSDACLFSFISLSIICLPWFFPSIFLIEKCFLIYLKNSFCLKL